MMVMVLVLVLLVVGVAGVDVGVVECLALGGWGCWCGGVVVLGLRLRC